MRSYTILGVYKLGSILHSVSFCKAIVDLDAVPIITNLLRDCTNADVARSQVRYQGTKIN